jgi:hypothetical protein
MAPDARMKLRWFACASLAALLGCSTRSPVDAGPSISEPIAAEAMGAESARGFRAFRGIQHTHVGEGGDDGQGSLAEAYGYGRDKAGLDFMAVSSHAHMISDDGYRTIARTAASFDKPGTFVAMAAQEWSTISKGGHINIIESASRCDASSGDWATFYSRWLPAHPEVGFVQFNHPHPDNPKEFGGAEFRVIERTAAAETARAKVVGMALINGPAKYAGEDMRGQADPYDMGRNGQNFEGEFNEFLNRGWRIGAVGDGDNHMRNWGTGTPTRTGVWAKALTKADIVAAFRARRTFAAWDHNASVWFAIGGKPMGSDLSLPGDLPAEVVAHDPDTPIARLEIHADLDGVGGRPAEVVVRQDVAQPVFRWALTLPAPTREAYYYAKVVYRGERAWAWTSPIWVRPRTVANVPLPAVGL